MTSNPRRKHMDTDLVQRKIEKFILSINRRNFDFDMMVHGSLRLNELSIKAREKQKVPTISHIICKENLSCPKCFRSDSVGIDTAHFAKCYRCNRRFILPNQPKCSKHSSMKPCRFCKAEKERKLNVH